MGEEKLPVLEGAIAQGQMEACRAQNSENSYMVVQTESTGATDTFILVQEKGTQLCPGRPACESVILTFDAFRLWLVHRVTRFAGSRALGQRVCHLLLF